MLSAYFDAYARDYRYYKGGAWCYEDGCIYRGLTLLDGVDPDGPWLGHLRRLVDGQVDAEGRLRGYRPEEFNLDNVQAGRALLYLHRRLGEDRYLVAAEALGRQLERHPRIAAGNYWHKLVYPQQVWLDGLYMALPFQIELGRATGRPALVADALMQLDSAVTLLRDTSTGLYRHGYDEARAQGWADPVTGLSPAYWSRAMGWLAMALVDVVDLVGAEATGAIAAASGLAAALAPHRTADGRWLQVTDQPGLAGNYPESSATAMLAYFHLAGARLGVAGVAAATGIQALDALAQAELRPGNRGRVQLGGICHVAGLGGFSGRYRDGSAAYYLSEPVVADDSKGVGPLMMAVAERRRTARVAGGLPQGATLAG